MLLCENDLCIYWQNERCILSNISLDTVGRCRECILVSLPEAKLKKLRGAALSELAGVDCLGEETRNHPG